MQYLIRMFYVEHMNVLIIRYLTSILCVLFVFSCKKKLDPSPELKDPVYAALTTELAAATSELSAKNSEVQNIKNDMKNAVPQSGEIKVYEKRLNEAQEKRAFAEQQVRLYEIRLEQQKLLAKKLYLESLLPNGKPWPDEATTSSEIEKIKIQKERMQRINGQHKIKPSDVPRGTPAEQTEKSKSTSGH